MNFAAPKSNQIEILEMIYVVTKWVSDHTGITRVGLSNRLLMLRVGVTITGHGPLHNPPVAWLENLELLCHCHQTVDLHVFGCAADIRGLTIEAIHPKGEGRVDLSLADNSPLPGQPAGSSEFLMRHLKQSLLEQAVLWLQKRYSTKTIGVLIPFLSMEVIKALLSREQEWDEGFTILRSDNWYNSLL